ncbi:MAG: DUF695 domain-containing protein [Cyclobacteriaceae bacterium]
MKEIRVFIPEEVYTILEFKQDNLPGIAVINTALRDFEQKEVFSWHLSVMMDLEDLIDNGMPSKNEREIIDLYEDRLDALIKGTDLEKPNALFLGRITWNKTRELIWRVYAPDIADIELKKIIKEDTSPRQFDYKMESDEKWSLTKWHLNKGNVD